MADLIESQDAAIASYPFGDIEEGLGFVTYYLYKDADTSGSEYNMGKTTVYSTDISENINDDLITRDFYSAKFNLPRILLGTAVFNFTAGYRVGAGASSYITLKLYHYDGTTSTQLGSTWQSPTKSYGGGNETATRLAKISVNSPQKFKKGDQIRLEVETVNTGPSNKGDTSYGFDPQNRDNSPITPSTNANHFTTFTCLIPFRVGL